MDSLILQLTYAALSAFLLTFILIVTQCRHTFQQIREAFVLYQRQCNVDAAASSNGSSSADGSSNNNNSNKKRGSKGLNQKKGSKSAATTNEELNQDEGTFTIGIFHPNCSSGGGGERVLWKAIEALGEMKEGKIPTRRGKMRRDDSGGSNGGGVIGEDRLRNCRNLSVVVYTVDEPSVNYQRGAYVSTSR
jgi:hypothetical protein